MIEYANIKKMFLEEIKNAVEENELLKEVLEDIDEEAVEYVNEILKELEEIEEENDRSFDLTDVKKIIEKTIDEMHESDDFYVDEIRNVLLNEHQNLKIGKNEANIKNMNEIGIACIYRNFAYHLDKKITKKEALDFFEELESEHLEYTDDNSCFVDKNINFEEIAKMIIFEDLAKCNGKVPKFDNYQDSYFYEHLSIRKCELYYNFYK